MNGASIAHDEELGRGVFSSRQAKRAQRSRVPHHVFLERSGCTDVSVDRLTMPSAEDAEAIAGRVAAARNSTFYGWAVVTAAEAQKNDRRVVPSPSPDNPRHADVVLPQAVTDDREEQKRHAQELADASRWRTAGDGSSGTH